MKKLKVMVEKHHHLVMVYKKYIMSKFIVLNSKGGVTKSTTAVQIIAPYLYWKNGKKERVNLVEFDDENEDCKTFLNSEILNLKRIMLTGNDLDSELLNSVLDNDNLVLDIGGNKTTTYILEAIKNTNIIDVFDCVIIPLTDGEQDSINAIKVYKQVKNLSKDIKIIFALGRVDHSMDIEIQFLDFFGDTKGRLNNKIGYVEDINKDDRNILKAYNSESVKVARTFGITVYELARQNIDNLKEKMKQYLKDKDTEKSKKAVYRITHVNKAIQFKNDVLEKCFKTIDEVVE